MQRQTNCDRRKLFEFQYSFLHEWDEVVNRKFPLKMNVNVSETKFRYQFISATSPLHPGAQDLLSTKTPKVNSQFIFYLYSWECLDPRRRPSPSRPPSRRSKSLTPRRNRSESFLWRTLCYIPIIYSCPVQTKHPLQTSRIHKALGKSNLGEVKY